MKMKYLTPAISALLLYPANSDGMIRKNEIRIPSISNEHMTYGKYRIPIFPSMRDRIESEIHSEGEYETDCVGNLWIVFHMSCDDCAEPFFASAFHRFYMPKEEVPEGIETEDMALDFPDGTSAKFRVSNKPCRYHMMRGDGSESGYVGILADPDCELNGNEHTFEEFGGIDRE